MSKINILTLMCILFLLPSLFAQSTQQWYFTYNGASDGNEELYGMTVDNAGNTILIAKTDTGFLDYTSVVMKLNPQGTLEWMVSERLNGTSSKPVAILTDAAGNIYVAGSYDSPGNSSSDIYLVKFDSAGNQLWATYYSSAGNIIDAARSMIWDNAGNIIVVGETGATVSVTDALVVKYDTAGNQLWFSVYSNPVNKQDQVADIAVDAEDNIYVCGNVYVDTSGRRDFQVFKMDSSGTVEWVCHYNDSLNYDDRCTAIIVDGVGDIIVTGESFGWGPGYPVNEIATIKYDATGNEQWITRYETSTSTAVPNALTIDENNNIYITGSAYDATSKFDCITIKYDVNGNQQWLQLIQGSLTDADGGQAILYDDGTIYIAGYVENNNTWQDGLVASYNESGTLLYREEWNSPNNDEDFFNYIAKDNDGNLIVAGTIEKLNDDDLLVVKFSPVNNVGVDNVEIPAFVIYPNPTSDEITIQGLRTGTYLSIVDLAGKEIFSKRITSTTSNFKLQTADIESGMYFVQARSGNKLFTTKLIIQR